MALRETRRAQRGAADLKSTTAGVEESAPVVASSEEIDLSKVELPPEVAAVVEGETDGTALNVKKKIVRAKRPAVKAE
jgi:small subunit ribosomal protein S2